MSVAYISMGSNVEDRLVHLCRSLDEMRHTAEIHVLRSSSIYETKPWGYTDQSCFLNAVVKIETTLEPESLLETLKRIEHKVGRTPSFRWGPREIDLDILLFNSLVLNSGELSIPHPGLTHRAFVLAPLLEIAPDTINPATNKPLMECWNNLTEDDRTGVVRIDSQFE